MKMPLSFAFNPENVYSICLRSESGDEGWGGDYLYALLFFIFYKTGYVFRLGHAED